MRNQIDPRHMFPTMKGHEMSERQVNTALQVEELIGEEGQEPLLLSKPLQDVRTTNDVCIPRPKGMSGSAFYQKLSAAVETWNEAEAN